MRKKIAFILPNLNSGGAERVTLTFLRNLDIEKFDIYLILLRKTDPLIEFVPDNATVIDLNIKKSILSVFKLTGILRKLKPHIVFTSHSRISFALFLVKLFSSSFFHIARMQGTPSYEKENNEYGAVTRLLYSIGFKSADVVIAQTKEMKEDAISVFGLRPEQIEVVNNPIDKKFIDESIQDTPNPFNQENINIVASGRIRHEKGYDILIQAFNDVVKTHPTARLFIIGDDKGDLQKLKKLLTKLKLTKYVIFLGFQKNPYIYYKYCDLFVLSSRWEGFPNALLENYYLNKKIVATRCVPIVSQLIQEGTNGYLCNVNDIQCLTTKIIAAINYNNEINNSYTNQFEFWEFNE